jgi:hypothetical protein
VVRGMEAMFNVLIGDLRLIEGVNRLRNTIRQLDVSFLVLS